MSFTNRTVLIAASLSLFLTSCRSTRPVPPSLSPAVFSPDAKAIFFSMVQGQNCFLYSTDIATGITRRLTDAKSGCETDPAFSPDGMKLAFMRAARAGDRSALVIANADGTAQRVLVSDQEDNLKPTFVPNSDQVLFLRSAAFEHYSPLVGNRRHKFDLFSAEMTNGRVTALTRQQFYDISEVSVSSDGKQVALTVISSPEGNHFILLSPDNPQSSPRSIQPSVPNAPKPPLVYNALWLPNSRSLLFSAASEPEPGRNFDYNVYRLDLSSRAVEQLTNLKGTIDGLGVSADGGKAVILRDAKYYLLDVTSHQLKHLQLQFE